MVRIIILSFAAMFSCLSAYSQNKYTEVIPYEDIDGLIVFPVSVRGVEFKFLFDPMSSSTILDDDAAKLGFEPDEELTRQSGGISVGSLRKLSIGRIIFVENIGVFKKPNEFLRENGISGIFGASPFIGYVVTVDAKSKTLTITTPYKPDYISLKHRANLERDLKSVIVDIGGRAIKTYLDITSGGRFLTLAREDSDALRDSRFTGNETILRRNGDYVKSETVAAKYDLKGFGFAGNTFTDEYAHIVEGDTIASFGAGILERGVLSLDYVKGRLYFQKYGDMDLSAVITTVMPDDGEEEYAEGRITPLTRLNFTEHIFDYKTLTEWDYKGTVPAIIDFWAPWCGPCKKLGETLEELASDYAGRIRIYKVNVDDEPEIAKYFGATALPMLLFIPKEGAPESFTGNTTKESLIGQIESMLK